MTNLFKSSLLAASGLALFLTSCGDNLLPEYLWEKTDAELLRTSGGIIEIKENIGDWDAAYLTEYGYFCQKDDISEKDEASEQQTYSNLTFMSTDENEKATLISTKEDNLPTQLVGELMSIYFNYTEEDVVEVLCDDGKTISKIDDVEYSKEDLSDIIKDLDDFKSKLLAAAKLLQDAEKSDSEADKMMETYSKIFTDVVGKDYIQNDDIADNISTGETGTYQFAETLSDWYQDEVQETVCNTLSLWTGEAVTDADVFSVTLNGAIFCTSAEFNELGTYGIICDESENNLLVGSARYDGKGYQSTDGKGFSIEIKDIKPNTKYYYRTYYKFNSANHGSLVSKYGNTSEQVIYDPAVKSFTLSVDMEKTVTVNGVSFKMIFVKGGEFAMGATPEQKRGYTPDMDESPVHNVTVSSFYMGETVVTQALWCAVMNPGTSSLMPDWNEELGEGDNYPAYYISYGDCCEFINRLNDLTGMTFRMPTEAEWEYAARGGVYSKNRVFAGGDNLADVAWFGEKGFHPVKLKYKNELGLYDMSGNIWEWCSDWYGKNYYSKSADAKNPKGPESGTRRVVRGGNFKIKEADYFRVSNREYSEPEIGHFDVGLRLVSK